MKYVASRDRLLLGGLAVALVVVFAKPIQYLLDLAREVEAGLGLSLLPALIILTGVFVLHQQRKRQEEQALARAAEAGAQQAEARAAELEGLVAFGEALGRALTLDAIRDVVLQQLPRLTGTDRAWVMVRQEGRWQAFSHEAGQDREKLELSYMDVVEHAVPSDPAKPAVPTNVYGHVCLPMTVGGEVVGLLAVPESDATSDGRRRVLAAAVTLLGTSLRNSQLFREVKDNSLRDGLTGCYNRTHTLDVIGAELRRARRSHQPVSLIMLDIDHFKQINDRYGHLCGDAVLATVGARMREALRGSDHKCRYGGEEFLVLLPETPIEGGRRVAETLRRAFADRVFPWKDQRLQITASFGVSVALPSETDVHALIGRADQAMYQAKHAGRNCVRDAGAA
jgi:diguanylate cyclase (GGDEF)-like protein